MQHNHTMKPAKKNPTSKGGSENQPGEKVYTQEDMAKVLTTAKMYKTMYEETSKQINILREEVKTCTDKSLLIVSNLIDRVEQLEKERTNTPVYKSSNNTELEKLTKHRDVERVVEIAQQKLEETQKEHETNPEEQAGIRPYGQKIELPNEVASTFLIRGLQGLRNYYQAPQADPAHLVHKLLYDVWCTYSRISIADKEVQQKGDRLNARAMIVIMKTPGYKKEAMIKLRKVITQNRIKGVSVCDYFQKDDLDLVKQMERVGSAWKREGRIIRYRVINKQGHVVLQTLEGGGNFKDTEVAEDELAKYEKAPNKLPGATTHAMKGGGAAPGPGREKKK